MKWNKYSQSVENQVLKKKKNCTLQVMSASFEVFSTWDDEFDKLQSMLRDLVKKKREEHLRMVWRVNPAHKRLQARMDHMRK